MSGKQFDRGSVMKTFRLCVAACASLLVLAGCGNGGDEAKGPVLLVVGATGGTGVEVVRQAQAQGYAVRALVREEPRARELLGPKVRYFVGDVLKRETLAPAFADAEFVISALGSNSRRDPENRPELVDFRGVAALAEEAKRAGVEHFVLVSSMGVTDPDHVLNKMIDNLMSWKLQGENALRASGVHYTIVRPGGLTNAAAGAAGLRFLQGDAKGMQGQVTRADVAATCLAALGRKEAYRKTFELIGEGSPYVLDWEKIFDNLRRDEAPKS
jgi:uncharacterized protein YbjT (DUF2867 family)